MPLCKAKLNGIPKSEFEVGFLQSCDLGNKNKKKKSKNNK